MGPPGPIGPMGPQGPAGKDGAAAPRGAWRLLPVRDDNDLILYCDLVPIDDAN